MKTRMFFTLIFSLLSLTALASPYVQDSSVMSCAQLTAAGGSCAQLIGTPKLWEPSLGEQLSTAITNGDICSVAAPGLFSQQVTPANPAAGFDKFYPKADNKFYGLTSAGVEGLIGPIATEAGAAHNYLTGYSNGVFSKSQPACSDLSNGAASCSTDTTNAANISSGLLALARGGTHADLSATGGVHQVVRQSGVGADLTVSQLAYTDVSGGLALSGTYYVDKVGVDSGSCGSIANPCLTIQQALTNIGDSAIAADVKAPKTVMIGGGTYDEALTMPNGRIITLVAQGTVVLGNGSGANWASTNTRDITQTFNTADLHGSDIKPSLTIIALPKTDTTSTFIAEAGGFFISGNLNITGDGGTNTLNTYNVKLAGNLVHTDASLTNWQSEKTIVAGTVTTTGNLVLERAYDSRFNGLLSVNAVNMAFNSNFLGGITVQSIQQNLLPNGFFHCNIAGTFTGPASSARFDLSTNYYFTTNAASLAGGATKVLLETTTSTPTASTVAGWDASSNMSANAFLTSTFEDFTEIATPANPAASHLRLYGKAGDGLYYLNSAGVEVQLATSGGITSLTGPITATGPGAAATTINANVVANSMLAQMPTVTIKGNNTGGLANALDLTVAQVNTMLGDILANGTVAFSGDQSMGSHKLTSVTDPTSNQDAATKFYVDSVAANGVAKAASVYATTAALPANTYNNGASGVGATLTGVAFGALVVDGNTVSVGQRILVKNEVTQANNGIYTVTTVGAVATLYVLTRATDFNQAADIVDGATTFITSGATLSNETWQLDVAGAVTVGTTALVFNQIAGPGTILAGNGLSLTGSTIALVAPVSVANGGTNSIAALNNNRVMKSSGGAIVEAAAITANRALVSDANGIPVHATTTDTEIGYVNGVTSAIQTQLNGKLPTAGTGLIEAISGDIETVSDKTYVLDQSAAYAYTINTLIIGTSSGTSTVAIKINGTNVTGISAVSVSSTPATGTATAANSVAIGDKVTLVTSATASAADMAFTLKVTR